ncbi:CocE/NonD family hydrolase [Conexibacter sp. JD483]|uniref:CocE/NonD family hydrolase n=1 Tax=unclassified Conexibacter TaxID=2627773 RepID=UPI00271A46E2|nr:MULTISPECIES: CocE/NonD family hydrolase [unclassified Conexibacter]MDO8186217.1 CocE/NonD family hydrolase [Conexibacter sp. CPCC 205706]MDO8199716.1 CocE/NonD family hydrolase [Conexibacter sp. CPCC 205762]MDR9368192.1 CocE/NonD family hydrolase [Conexibacter sp. JD483]
MEIARAAGTEAGQRRLNGPQTMGRDYRGLSRPQHGVRSDEDVTVSMRDGVTLLADVHRPDAEGRFPALIAASCYPRQIQNSGAPMGFVEAGATDFWVPRGYVHVIANLRGTGGSGGTFTFLDATERGDLHDLVEWAAAQPWCDGRVGMIGISYFAMAQLAAAAARPPHLRAIFPLAATADAYEATYHHGLRSETFVANWIAGVGGLADKGDRLFRSRAAELGARLLKSERVHARLEHFNGEAALSTLGAVMRMRYAPEWDELWSEVVADHPLRDAFWDERDLLPLLEGLEVPVYLGCDWDNVPLHLPATFALWKTLSATAPTRMGMLGSGGLTWPWESLHVEALAWFDHWLKGADTGIMEGPPIRYVLPGADDEVRTAETWPPPGAVQVELALRADGLLAAAEGEPGARDYRFLPETVRRPKGAPAPALPASLTWESETLTADVDLVGELELRLDAATTVPDAAWIATLQDVAPDGAVTDVTAGWLRASLRAVDEAASRPGAPLLRCRTPRAVPPGEVVSYRIPLVPNARRFAAGHRIRLVLASADDGGLPTVMSFRHAVVGDAARHSVRSSSRLLLPLLAGADQFGG